MWNPAPPTDDPPLTPLYDSLTTNIPHPIMAYTSFSFPPSTLLFPPAHIVQNYLVAFSDHFDLRQYVQFNTRVTNLWWDGLCWKLVTDQQAQPEDFDFVVVSNGHYRKPYYPPVPGLQSWIDAKKISHSSWYRRPSDLGQVVLVVGAGPSGHDISEEIQSTAQTVIRSMTGAPPNTEGKIKIRGRVTEFLPDGQVRFEDGLVEGGIDFCILATGYEMSFPFMSPSELIPDFPPSCPPLPSHLYNSTFSVFPLAKHVFPVQKDYPPSTIAFLGLPIRVAPFPAMEAQAQAALRVFAHPEALNLTEESVDIITHYETVGKRIPGSPVTHRDIIKNYHKFTDREQFDYRDQLYEFASREEGGPPPMKVPGWIIEAYEEKGPLRRIWQQIVRDGKGEETVKGVGEGGIHEWEDLIGKLLDRSRTEERSRL